MTSRPSWEGGASGAARSCVSHRTLVNGPIGGEEEFTKFHEHQRAVHEVKESWHQGARSMNVSGRSRRQYLPVTKSKLSTENWSAYGLGAQHVIQPTEGLWRDWDESSIQERTTIKEQLSQEVLRAELHEWTVQNASRDADDRDHIYGLNQSGTKFRQV